MMAMKHNSGIHPSGPVAQIESLTADRRAALKRAFSTRYVPDDLPVALGTGVRPRAGDLVVARVAGIGQHQRLELTTGRRSILHVGDEVLVAYGNRYAPDQFEAYVPDDLGPCDLAAAGGVAGVVTSRHSSRRAPTRLLPVGVALDADGGVINLDRFRLDRPSPADRLKHGRIPVLLVVGSSMNAGKTTTATSLIRGLVGAGRAVGAAKVTGTGAGGDLWSMTDAGASPVVDFTTAGMATTFLADIEDVIDGFERLVGHLERSGAEVAVVEIADGVYQRETAALLNSAVVARRCDAVVFAAGEALGACGGVAHLRHLGLPVVAVSGTVSASPLAGQEVERVTGLPVMTKEALAGQAGADLVPTAALTGAS